MSVRNSFAPWIAPGIRFPMNEEAKICTPIMAYLLSRKLLTLLVALLLAFPYRSVDAQNRNSTGDSLLVYSARVRIMATALAPGWHTGLIGKVGDCLVVLVPSSSSGPRPSRFKPVPFDSITALHLSRRYDGRLGTRGKRRTYAPGADTVREGWQVISVAELRRRHGQCTPF